MKKGTIGTRGEKRVLFKGVLIHDVRWFKLMRKREKNTLRLEASDYWEQYKESQSESEQERLLREINRKLEKLIELYEDDNKFELAEGE